MLDGPSLPIIQNCWVVPDIEAAAKGWLKMGVGPFFMFDMDVQDALYRGRREPLQFTVALAQAGEIQIELITPKSAGPCAYHDGVAPGTSGFHHVCREFGAYDETIEQLRRQDIAILTEGTLGELRFCYADTRPTLGCMLELVDKSAAAVAFNDGIRAAALNWDGKDPIRRVAAPKA